MVFGESRLKDVYRRLVWGPWRVFASSSAPGLEVQAHRAMGRVAAQANPAQRARVVQAMRGALGESIDAEELAALAFETHFVNQYIGFSFDKIRLDTWSRYSDVMGLNHLDRALGRGRGVVLAHPHMGMAQLPLHLLGLLGYPTHQVGGGLTQSELSATGQWAAATRARLEGKIRAELHDGQRYLRPVLRALDGGQVVFTACDGTGGGVEIGRRLPAKVLGRTLQLPVFPVWLALHTGAVLCPMATWRSVGPGPLSHIGIEPALALEGDARDPDAVQAGVDQLAAFLDRSLRDHPADWHFWDAWHDGPGGLLHHGE